MHHSGDVTNLLLGLAWFGEISSDHIRRLWAPHDQSDFGVRATLHELRREGYVTRRHWSRPRPGGGPPLRQPAMWALTNRGRDLLNHHELFPPRLFLPRARRTLAHDAMTSELLTRMIELARPAGLSGCYLEREVRIDPARSRPVMDAIVILRTGGGYEHDDLVLWSRDPLLPGERRRRYAIENDRDSEPLSVIAGKAHAYQAALTLDWGTRYGGFPIPVWLVPSSRRRDAIMQTWRSAWAQGKWLMTTDDDLQRDYWLEFQRGVIRERHLFVAQRDHKGSDFLEKETSHDAS